MGAEISVNRKALRDYHILERMEAGIELKGTEKIGRASCRERV